jgi:hypothetical protein
MNEAKGSAENKVSLKENMEHRRFLADPYFEELARITGADGCSMGEIEEVRASARVDRLPGAYVEFLQMFGKGNGRGGVGKSDDIAFFYPAVLVARAQAERILENSKLDFELQADALVFSTFADSQFLFMNSDIGEDPPVRLCFEGEVVDEQDQTRFSDYIRDALPGLLDARV